MGNAAESDAQVVVCTCSTIGGPAESMETGGRFCAMRIDRAMADAAVKYDKIGIVAALDSTLRPTTDLVNDSAARQKRSPEISCVHIPDVWGHFLAGHMDAYQKDIADYLQAHCDGPDVIVLAQASMAGAADLCENINIPILSSPRMGVEKAIEVLKHVE